MRILMINHEFTITGASLGFLRLALYLQRQGHELHLFALNPDNGPVKAEYEARNIPILINGTTADYDLIIANSVCTGDAVLKLARGSKTIWFLRETEIAIRIFLEHNDWIEALGLAQAVIFQTRFQRDMLRTFTYDLNPSKFHVIPNGIDAIPEHLPRERIPAKTRPLRVVQVGTVEPRKRPGDLIRAVAQSGLDIECVIVGKYEFLPDAVREMIAAAPGKFLLAGETRHEETLAWIESADMVCLASSSESQPAAVLEAGLLAKPLLLTSLPVYQDIFTHGRNCLMFPPGNVPLLAGLMRMLAASAEMREGLGSAARHTARRFSSAAFFARFEPVLQAVAAGA